MNSRRPPYRFEDFRFRVNSEGAIQGIQVPPSIGLRISGTPRTQKGPFGWTTGFPTTSASEQTPKLFSGGAVHERGAHRSGVGRWINHFWFSFKAIPANNCGFPVRESQSGSFLHSRHQQVLRGMRVWGSGLAAWSRASFRAFVSRKLKLAKAYEGPAAIPGGRESGRRASNGGRVR